MIDHLPTILLLTLRERSRLLLWTCVGALFIVAYTCAVFPSISSDPAFSQALENMPDDIAAFMSLENVSLASGPGYVNAEVFTFTLPVLLAAIAIGAGAGVIAGEEAAGRMTILLGQPIGRGRLALERGVGVLLVLAIPAAVTALALALADPVVDLDLSLTRVLSATAATWVYASVTGAVAFAFAGLTGRVGTSRGVAAGLAIAAYLVASIGNLVDWMAPTARFMPYRVLSDGPPLINGANWSLFAGLAAATVALGGVGIAGFTRRDTRGGA